MILTRPVTENRAQRLTAGPELPATVMDGIAAAFGADTLGTLLARQGEIQRAETRGQGAARRAARTGRDMGDTTPDVVRIPADVLNERYRSYGVTFDAPMTEEGARLVAEARRAQNIRNDTLARAPGGLANVAYFGAGLAGVATDPIEVATAFVPLVGPTRLAALTARLGTVGGRVAAGAIEGAGGALLTEPLYYGLSRQQRLDYEMADALLNVGLGGALGGALGAGAGVLARRREARAVDALAGDVEALRAATEAPPPRETVEPVADEVVAALRTRPEPVFDERNGWTPEVMATRDDVARFLRGETDAPDVAARLAETEANRLARQENPELFAELNAKRQELETAQNDFDPQRAQRLMARVEKATTNKQREKAVAQLEEHNQRLNNINALRSDVARLSAEANSLVASRRAVGRFDTRDRYVRRAAAGLDNDSAEVAAILADAPRLGLRETVRRLAQAADPFLAEIGESVGDQTRALKTAIGQMASGEPVDVSRLMRPDGDGRPSQATALAEQADAVASREVDDALSNVVDPDSDEAMLMGVVDELRRAGALSAEDEAVIAGADVLTAKAQAAGDVARAYAACMVR